MTLPLRRGLGAAAAVLVLTACSSPPPQTAEAPSIAPAPPTAAARPSTAPQPLPTKRPRAKPRPTPSPAPPPATGVEAVELAQTPRELAQILTVAETAIRDESVTGLALAEAAHTQQRTYRRLSLQPRW